MEEKEAMNAAQWDQMKAREAAAAIMKEGHTKECLAVRRPYLVRVCTCGGVPPAAADQPEGEKK